jgi:hypothetical protein
LRGFAGISRLLRQEGGTTGAWIGLECGTIAIEGVIFDANGTQVQANTWNVLVDTTATYVQLSRCAFRNNSGSLGRGLAIIGSGSAGLGASYIVDACEFSGNSSDGCGIFQANGVVISRSRAFSNGGSGIGASVFGTSSSSELNQVILVQGNRCWNNSLDGINIGTLNPGGSNPPIYTLASPSAATISIVDNIIWSNGGYGIQAYGDYLDIRGNQVTQLTSAAGGLVATARYSRIAENAFNVPGVYIGIDSGGCYDCDINSNSVTGAHIGINPGGSQFVTVSGNKIRDCAIGMSVYDIEADGNGVPFPAPVSGLTIERNTIIVTSGSTGLSVLDGGSGIVILENRFFGADSTVSPNQALALRSAGVSLRGNTWNGLDRIDLNPNPQNLLEVPDVFDTINVPSGGEVIDSLLPASVITSMGQVSFLSVTAGGANYTHATVSFVGAGAQAQATVMVYGGQVIGFRVTNNGSGYVSGQTTCVISGDGSGATATVTIGNPIQINRCVRLLARAGITVKLNGQQMIQANATLRDLVLVNDSAVEFVECGGNWLVTGFYPAAILQSKQDGSVVLASPSGAPIALLPGAGGNLLAPSLPNSAGGLPPGSIWRNGNVLNIV